MMKKSILAALAAMFTLFSCLKIESAVETINLGGSEFYVEVGGTMRINAVLIPETAKDAVLTWTSDTPEVATVENGVVTALTEGKTTIVVRAESGVTASCVVYVTPVVTGISLPAALTVYVGGSTVLTPKFTPEGAASTDLVWSSADESIATVSQDGVVTGVNGGRTTVTVTCKEYSATCQVKVREAAIGVELDITEADLKVGVDELQLTAIVEPANSIDYDLDWTTSDEAVAVVSDKGLVTPVGPGEATITVTVDKAHQAACVVRVTQPAEGVFLNKTELRIQLGTSETLEATVQPATTNVKDLKWTSSNPEVASVDANGQVSALALGTADITVTTVDGGHTAVCKVTVIQSVTGVTLDAETATLRVGEQTLQLTAVVQPSDASDKSLVWTSSNVEVASVSETGLVTPLASGEALITVTTVDGGFSATCAVTVVQPVLSVTLNETSININPDMTFELVAQINPDNADNKELEWKSSDESVVTVDQNGVVTGVETGVGREATITVTSKDSGVSATCVVRVTKDVVGVELDCQYKRIEAGKEFQLTAIITPSDATNTNVVWTSSDSEVASVDATGKVTARSAGTAVITVTTEQNGYTATCKVVVRSAGTSDNEGFEEEDEFGWN
jgi:uncharacterized protein YjdB